MREKFFKTEISENISQKSYDRLDNTDLLSVERYELKNIDFDDFTDEFHSRHDKWMIKLHWSNYYIKL